MLTFSEYIREFSSAEDRSGSPSSASGSVADLKPLAEQVYEAEGPGEGVYPQLPTRMIILTTKTMIDLETGLCTPQGFSVEVLEP